MPPEPEPEQAFPPPTDAERAAILDAVQSARTPDGYGDRFAEDAFDYPSSSTHSWSADPAPTGSGEPDAEPQGTAGPHGPTARAARTPDGWRQAAVRRRSVLMATAALLVVGGFGFALSTVSDTVTSPPSPGGTVQVSVPKSPTAQPFSPPAPATTEPPGGDAASPAAIPTRERVPPGTVEHRDGDEDQGREDGDHADD